MEIRTRYNVGEVVYAAVATPARLECGLCLGTGHVTIAGSSGRALSCPDCAGIGSVTNMPGSSPGDPSYLVFPLRIEVLRAEIVTGYDEETRVPLLTGNIVYLAAETNDGGGRQWHEDELHPSADEAARWVTRCGGTLHVSTIAPADATFALSAPRVSG